MALAKLNYIVLYEDSSQVYGSSSLETALKNPPPKGVLGAKRILFINFEPDTKQLIVQPLADEDMVQKTNDD